MTNEAFFAQLCIPVPGDFAHGTYDTFADHGCRCPQCCGAFSSYRDTGKNVHGTPSGYNNHKCRCGLCLAAKNKTLRDYYARRKEAKGAGA